MHLEVRDLRVHYDGIQAVHGVSFSVRHGEIVTLIGANGAGKTSILRAISGLVPYGGTSRSPAAICAACRHTASSGSAWRTCPEGRGIFGNLTVRENLRSRRGSGVTAARSRRTWHACSRFSRGSVSGSTR